MKVAFTFGRMNPMTTGHMNVVNTLERVNADKRYIYLSHSQDPKKNPLPYWLKKTYVNTFIKGKNVKVKDSEAKTPIDALKELNKDFNEVAIVVGGDRLEDFQNLINKYNGAIDKEGNLIYKFDTIEYINAGIRDEHNSMSASKVRDFVRENDYESFLKAIPTKDPNIARDYWEDIKEYLK